MKRLLVALLVAAGIIGAPSPAQAVACDSTHICFMDNTNGTTLLQAFAVGSPSVCRQLSASASNRTSYIINHTAHSYVVYDNGSCSSAPGYIYANSIGPMAGAFNNTISSFYMNP